MILGNSNGNNRGKKYFKDRDKNKSKELCFADKVEVFDKWFTANIKPLKTQLFNKYYHPSNEDVFNDTYIRIYERIYFTGFNIADYKSYFCRAFYTNHVQELTKQNRFADIDYADNLGEDDNEEEMELEQKHKQLEEEIFDFVYQHFDLREYEIFKMYMHLKIQGKNMTYEVLADIIHNDEYKAHHIQAIISKIKKVVAEEFANQWAEVS